LPRGLLRARYGPIYYEALRLEEREERLDSALCIVQRGLAEIPRYGPLWFGYVRVAEQLDVAGWLAQVRAYARAVRRRREFAGGASSGDGSADDRGGSGSGGGSGGGSSGGSGGGSGGSDGGSGSGSGGGSGGSDGGGDGVDDCNSGFASDGPIPPRPPLEPPLVETRAALGQAMSSISKELVWKVLFEEAAIEERAAALSRTEVRRWAAELGGLDAVARELAKPPVSQPALALAASDGKDSGEGGTGVEELKGEEGELEDVGVGTVAAGANEDDGDGDVAYENEPSARGKGAEAAAVRFARRRPSKPPKQGGAAGAGGGGAATAVSSGAEQQLTGLGSWAAHAVLGASRGSVPGPLDGHRGGGSGDGGDKHADGGDGENDGDDARDYRWHDGLAGSRAALAASALACPPNLRWKVWLAGGRVELGAPDNALCLAAGYPSGCAAGGVGSAAASGGPGAEPARLSSEVTKQKHTNKETRVRLL